MRSVRQDHRAGCANRSQPNLRNKFDMQDSRHEVKTRVAFTGRKVSLASFPLERETAALILVSMLDLLMTIALMVYSDAGKTEPPIGERNALAGFFFASWGFRGMIAFKFALVGLIVFITQVLARYEIGTARKVLNLGTVIIGGVAIYGFTVWLRTTTFL
jgi:hypothetical protein